MSFMPPTDSMFLLAESRDHPMHVGGLQLFVPPEGAGAEFTADMLAGFGRSDDVSALFRKRPGPADWARAGRPTRRSTSTTTCATPPCRGPGASASCCS